MSMPWTLALSAVIGIWLMAAPGVFDVTGRSADIQHLGGALIVTTSVIAMGEPVRALRFLNVLLGLAVAIGPILFAASPGTGQSLVAGLVVVVLALPRGPQREHYGSWDRWIR